MASEHRLSYWAQVLRERAESGLSIRAFCQEARIHENVFFYWQRKLREKAFELTARQKETMEINLVPQGFMEVKIDSQTTQDQQMPTSSQIRIECGRVRITTDSAYPTNRLALLLKELVQL